MSDSNSVLAALAGFTGTQETFVSSGERFPTIRWRSGSVDTQNMVKLMGNNPIPDDVYLALNGYWFISEDDVPADNEGAQIEMTGFTPFGYTNTNNKEVVGFAAPTISFNIVGMRMAHFAEDGRHYFAWQQGWDEDAYNKGYTRRRLQARVVLEGISDHEFIIDVEGKKQYDFRGNTKHEGVVYSVEKTYLPLIGKELGASKILPLMVAKITVGPKVDEKGEVIFSSSTYTEDGQEKEGKATTTFVHMPPASIKSMIASGEEIAQIVKLRNECEEWLTEWNESRLATASSKASEDEAPTAEGI